jgi:hypothetical protein
LDRTVALAKRRGGFGWQALRAALDSSPVLGAGRVEDTWNLVGRALRAVATCAAKTLKVSREQVLRDAGVTLLGAVSLKAALDIDWGDPAAQAEALARRLADVDRLEQWVATHVPVAEAPSVQAALTALRRILTQDLEPDPTTGQRRIRRGVAAERMPSLGDPDMRHGPQDADAPLHRLQAPCHHTRRPGCDCRAKAWTSPNGGRFPKQAFVIQLEEGRVTCPAQQTAAIPAGATTVHFAATVCQPCPLRAACTTATSRGRTMTIHPQEALLQRLRAELHTPDGRTRLRHRTTLEHSLARVSHIQGPRARYKGIRKNTLDVRRVAVVANLQRIARLPKAA